MNVVNQMKRLASYGNIFRVLPAVSVEVRHDGHVDLLDFLECCLSSRELRKKTQKHVEWRDLGFAL